MIRGLYAPPPPAQVSAGPLPAPPPRRYARPPPRPMGSLLAVLQIITRIHHFSVSN